MITLNTLRWGDYSGLSEWALKVITSIYKREVERPLTTEEETSVVWW